MEQKSRRDLLKLGSSGVVAGLAGCSSLSRLETFSEASKQDLRDRIIELEAKLEVLRKTVEEKDERIESLEAELDELKQHESAAISGFSHEELERARTVATEVRKAVVTIGEDNRGGGTAWFLDDGHVITNSHVVDGLSNVKCWTIDGQSFEPTLLGKSEHQNLPYDDVAVLKTDFEPPNKLPLGHSSSLTEDQPVVQVGHPGMVGYWIATIGRFVRDGPSDNILSTVPGRPGNSGGPLVTLDGNVVGIVTGETPRDPPSDQQRGTPSDQSTIPVPEPEDVKVYERFPKTTYATHDTTSIIRKYVEKFG